MPTGPKGQKRPADVIGNAVKVMKIATGEEEEDVKHPEEAPELPEPSSFPPKDRKGSPPSL